MRRASTRTMHTLQSNGHALSSDGTRDRRHIRKRSPRIVPVASCTNRKLVKPPSELRLGSVAGNPDQRSAEWSRRLRTIDAPRMRTDELYVGEHWRVVRDAYELTLKYSVRAELWVVSAGYGLVESARRI